MKPRDLLIQNLTYLNDKGSNYVIGEHVPEMEISCKYGTEIRDLYNLCNILGLIIVSHNDKFYIQ